MVNLLNIKWNVADESCRLLESLHQNGPIRTKAFPGRAFHAIRFCPYGGAS